MKKRIIAILLAAALLMILPAAVVAAQVTTTHTININVGGEYQTKSCWIYCPPTKSTANVNIGGQLKEKNGNWYLSPLKGNITIAGESHEIVVKQLNQSQRVNYIIFPSQVQEWYSCVEVNIEGDKYAGVLYFKVISPTSGQSVFSFEGIKDGEIARFWPTYKPMPDIDPMP